MASQKKEKFVEVIWYDATGHSGWKTLDEAKELKLTKVISHGILLHTDDDKVIIAGSKSDDGDYSSIDVIPATWVKKVKTIKVENL